MFNHDAPHGYLLPTMYLFMQISQIQTCLCVVVGPEFVSTLPVFMRHSASHPAGPHGWFAGNGRFRHNLQSSL